LEILAKLEQPLSDKSILMNEELDIEYDNNLVVYREKNKGY